jgi:hypothetical protein
MLHVFMNGEGTYSYAACVHEWWGHVFLGCVCLQNVSPFSFVARVHKWWGHVFLCCMPCTNSNVIMYSNAGSAHKG